MGRSLPRGPVHSAHTCQAKPQASETRKNYGAAMKAHTEMPKKRVLRKEVSSTEVTEESG